MVRLVVDLLSRVQLRRYLGALPLLYGLLEALQVRDIINRHCPTAAEVDHGTVALVLILNRLVAPRPLLWVADWVARTVLVATLGIPAAKFNDDRLGRTLEALSQHSREIWQDIVHRALVQADIDLSVIFYDLTAFAVHGDYAGSAHIDFGFAHNTPMDQRKFKVSLDVAADGNLPSDYGLWSGRTADMATVQQNMVNSDPHRLDEIACTFFVTQVILTPAGFKLPDRLFQVGSTLEMAEPILAGWWITSVMTVL